MPSINRFKPRTNHRRLRQPRRVRGFNLIEMVISIAVFALIMLLFAALFPVATRGSGEARAYAQAALLSQRKIDQMRQIGYSKLNAQSLRAANIIDATSNADGTFSFSRVDSIVDYNPKQGFYPAGTVASISLTQPLPQQGSNAPPLSRAVLVTVRIAWPGGGFHGGEFVTHTIIASK